MLVNCIVLLHKIESPTVSTAFISQLIGDWNVKQVK